jgi:hypothetical protein
MYTPSLVSFSPGYIYIYMLQKRDTLNANQEKQRRALLKKQKKSRVSLFIMHELVQ